MKFKWILVFSIAALCLALILTKPEDRNVTVNQSTSQSQNIEPASENVLPRPKEPVVEHSQARDLLDSRSTGPVLYHQPHSNQPYDEPRNNQMATTVTPDVSDAFPDDHLLTADQIADHHHSDEVSLEADRAYVDVHFPVEESIAVELSEAELEYQRYELEQEIAEELAALEQNASLTQADFELPPFEQ